MKKAKSCLHTEGNNNSPRYLPPIPYPESVIEWLENEVKVQKQMFKLDEYLKAEKDGVDLLEVQKLKKQGKFLLDDYYITILPGGIKSRELYEGTTTYLGLFRDPDFRNGSIQYDPSYLIKNAYYLIKGFKWTENLISDPIAKTVHFQLPLTELFLKELWDIIYTIYLNWKIGDEYNLTEIVVKVTISEAKIFVQEHYENLFKKLSSQKMLVSVEITDENKGKKD